MLSTKTKINLLKNACKLRANKKGFKSKNSQSLVFTSGEDGARTHDLLAASQAL